MPTTAINAPGIFLFTRPRPTMTAENRQRHGKRRKARFTGGYALERMTELLERRAAAFTDAEEPAELTEGDLDADAGEEADQDTVRQEVGDEAEAIRAAQR